MIQQTPHSDRFKQKCASRCSGSRSILAPSKLPATPTSTPAAIKTRWFSSSRAAGSNCSCSRLKAKSACLPIHSAGDIFGELCLSGSGARLETATAMEETILKQIPRSHFLAALEP